MSPKSTRLRKAATKARKARVDLRARPSSTKSSYCLSSSTKSRRFCRRAGQPGWAVMRRSNHGRKAALETRIVPLMARRTLKMRRSMRSDLGSLASSTSLAMRRRKPM